MARTDEKGRRRGPTQLAALVGKTLDPITAKRGFASADLIAAWPEIVGPRYAATTQPEKIVWPRPGSGEDRGVLTVRVEGPIAIYFQHEVGQVVEQVNRFLGFGAVGQIRIVQKPIDRPIRRPLPQSRPASAAEEAELARQVAGIADEGLQAALKQLGRAVITRKISEK